MNIEQIAKEARLSMLRDFNGLSKEINICVKDDTEFLRRRQPSPRAAEIGKEMK